MIFGQIGFLFLIVEIVATIALIDGIGFFSTIFLWLCSAVAGAMIVRAQGLSVLTRAQKSFDAGQLPVDEIYDSFCLMIAGALFILPGFVSDVLAFCLLVPMIRKSVRARSAKYFDLKEAAYTRADDSVIEGTYVRVEEEPEKIDYRSPKT